MKNRTVLLRNTDKNTFQPIVKYIHHIVGLPVSVWTRDKTGKTLRIVASAGLPESYVRTASLNLDQPSVTVNAFKMRKIQRVMDIDHNTHWKNKTQAKNMKLKSAICLPIEVNHVVECVLNVYAYTRRSIVDAAQILPGLGEQVALTLEVTRQKEIRQHILDVGLKLQTMAENPIGVLKEIVKGACELTGASSAVVYPYDSEIGEFYDVENIASFGLKNPLIRPEKPRLKGGMASQVMKQGEVTIADLEKQGSSGYAKSSFIRKEEIRACMGIALMDVNDVLGVLYVNFSAPHIFNQSEKDTIRLFALQASNALKNARLYQQAKIQIEALEKLHEVGTTLTSVSSAPQNLETTLLRIAKAAQQVLGAELIDLYQYFQSEDRYVLPPIQVGSRYDNTVAKKEIYKDDVIYQIVKRKQSNYVVDAQNSKSLTKAFTVKRGDVPKKRFVIREDIKSSASIPLIAGKEVVGVLFINYRTLQRFSQEQIKLIELFAHQASIAVYNSRLYKEIDARAADLEKLQDAGASILAIPKKTENLRKTLTRIARDARKLLDAELIDIYQYFQNSDSYDLPPIQVGDRFKPSIKKDKIYEDDIIWGVVKGRVPKYVTDAQSDNDLKKPFKIKQKGKPIERFVVREKIKSTAAIPLIVNNEVVGVLFANYRVSQDFSSQQQHLIELFAHQSAISIWNARLFTSVQERLGERLADIGAFKQIYEKMYGSKQNRLFSLIADQAARLTGGKYSGVWLVDKTGKKLELGGLGGGHRPTHDLPAIPINRNSINGWVVNTKKSYVSNDARNDRHYKEWYADTRSELTVPLLLQNKVIGTLNVESTVIGNFTSDHQKLLEALASQAVVIIQNAKVVKRLDTLDDIGRVLTSAIRKKEAGVLDLIYKEASKLMDTDNMYIALNDETTNMVRFGLAFVNGKKINVDKKSAWQPRKAGKGKTEEIIRTRGPILHTTEAEEASWYEQGGHKKHISFKSASWIGVPMTVGNRVLGVIAMYHQTQEHLYSRDDQDILQSMANQAAIALDNSRLYYDANLRLSALVKFEQALTSGIKQGESKILEIIHEQAGQLMDTNNMYIAFHDEATNMVRFGLAYVNGKKVDVDKEPGWQPRKTVKGRTEEIIQTTKPIFHPTKSEAEKWYAKPGHVATVKKISSSWMGVPMLASKKVLGVIATYHPTKEYVYSGGDLEILQSMANQAAIALESAYAFKKVQNQIEDLETVNSVAQSISTMIGTRELLQTIVYQIRERLNCSHCAIFLPEHKDGQFVLLSKYTDGRFAELLKRQQFKIGEGITGWVFEHGKTALLHNAPEDKRFVPVKTQKYNLHSLLAVPVKMNNQVIGVISADDVHIGRFDEDDQRLLETLAEHIGIALDKQKRIDELEGMQELGNALATETNLESLLAKVVENAVQVLKADTATVYQFDPGTEEFYVPVIFGSENQDLPSKTGGVSKIVKNGRIILAENPSEIPYLKKSRFVAKKGVKSCAAVPLQYGGKPIGIIFVNYISQKHSFTPSDERAIRYLADQASTAINMAGILYNTNQQLETVEEIVNAVEIHADLHKYLEGILRGVLGRVNAKNGTIQLYDPKRDELMVWAKVGNVTNQSFQHIPLNLGITGKAARERRPIYVSDVKASTEYINYISDTQSEHAVPILIGDSLVGVLNIEDPKPNAFSPYSRQLIERLGDKLAILIRQKQKAQEVEQKRLTYQVNESLGLVTMEVAHKVGNAAGKIRVLTREHLKDKSNLTKSQAEDIDIILRNVEEMIKSTDDLFRPFEEEPKAEITVTQMIREARGQCAIPINVRVIERVPSNLPKVSVETTKVQDYLAELLNNAIKYAIKGMKNNRIKHSQIEIVGQRSKDGFIEVLITNHGPAIPSERWESIFKVFSANGPKVEDEQSYGLGLWGARTTMQKQGGDVLLLESDDTKTTFVVRLPPA